MSWQEVLSEFGETGNTCKEMAEEIVLLRPRLGPAESEMLMELRRLREAHSEIQQQRGNEALANMKRLAISESKRAQLRNACELALAFHERGANINWSTVRSALAIDAAEDSK